MPLVNKKPFIPNPIPNNLNPDDEVFYLELTNEIFTSHDAFFDRFLYCNSLIWTCSKTLKSGLTYREALDSEQQQSLPKKKKKKKNKAKRERSSDGEPNGEDSSVPIKKKKKKYPYDPKKYSMPVPDGFDPSLLTPTGKIDGRKLKSKKNKQLADELLLQQQQACQPSTTTPETQPKKGKQKKKIDDEAKKEEEAKRKEEEAKKKAQLQAELAKERELEAKRKKEAIALAKQLERQKKEEERKKAAAFLQNWEKKCEDLERDDLRRLPQPTPLSCDIPEKLFGDAIFILESLYNLHELHSFTSIFPEGLSYDTLEEMLIDKQEDGPLGTTTQYLLRVIFDTQPTGDGYGLDDDPTKGQTVEIKQENTKGNNVKPANADNGDPDQDHETNCLGSEPDDEEEEEEDENEDKDVNMNDLIGSAIRAAQEVKKSLTKPLPELELNSTNVTEILRLHLLQSGSFPKGRTIYNGWYSSREDPGLWLCMREPDLIKKLAEVTIYDLEIEDRIKILHTLIYQLFSFIKTRTYIESASEQLTELRKQYRGEAAAFARWDRENCVKRMQPPKRKSEQNVNNQNSIDKTTNGNHHNVEQNLNERSDIITNNQIGGSSNPGSLNGDDANEHDEHYQDGSHDDNISSSINKHESNNLKSCLKANGLSTNSNEVPTIINNDNNNDDIGPHPGKKKITFKAGGGINGAIGDNNCSAEDCELEQTTAHDDRSGGGGAAAGGHQEFVDDTSDQTFEDLERVYQQNQVDYEDYQRERAIRFEELNHSLVSIRQRLREHQSIYGIHPVGRDRAYRRYWLFQSLPGLFVEQDDEYLGHCLPNPTPLESRYKKLFNKDNPLMHPNESDLIRTKTCDVGCSTDAIPPTATADGAANSAPEKEDHHHHDHQNQNHEEKTLDPQNDHRSLDNNEHDNEENAASDRLAGEQQEDHDDHQDIEPNITDEMNYCTGDENTCAIHGQKRPTQPRWWFYHSPESIDTLVECLNKRGYRESELHDVLSAESSIIKPEMVKCPAFKLNRSMMEQSGIRRSRRLRTKGSKRRGRNYD